MHALIVDDSTTMRMILKAHLKKLGFEVTEAVNGRDALDRLKAMATADLVMVDWNMPEMDGLAFVRAVRTEIAYAALPMMMVTTNTDRAHVSRSARRRRQRIHHETVHRGHDSRKARAPRPDRGVAMRRTRVLRRGRLGRHPPLARPRRWRARRRSSCAGSASNGRIALMKIPLLRPDVVVLDMEMPEISGLETLSAIRAAYPTLPVIMLSPSTGAVRAGLTEALALGAVSCVFKPALDAAHRRLAGAPRRGARREDPAVLPRAAVLHRDRAGADRRATPPPDGDRTEVRVDVLAIAVSTGGPSALMDLIPRFPKDFPVPIVIVQHMPPTFTKLLAERLAARSSIRVVEGSLHQALAPGWASIAPGDFHMAVARDGDAVRIRLHQEPPENSCRPAADVLFRSVAQVYGRHVLAVVMTGHGTGRVHRMRVHPCRRRPGHRPGRRELRRLGHAGLRRQGGMADQILPLSALGPEIIRKVWNHRRKPAAAPAVPVAPRAGEAGRR